MGVPNPNASPAPTKTLTPDTRHFRMIIAFIYLCCLVFAIMIVRAAALCFPTLTHSLTHLLTYFLPRSSRGRALHVAGHLDASHQRYTDHRTRGCEAARPVNYPLVRRQILMALIPQMPATRHPSPVTRH